jgi:hypothetical protein
MKVPFLTNPQGISRWQEAQWDQEHRGGMQLTPRIGTTSLRLRTSEPGYATDWHVAGEPVLIVVQRGVLRIELRDGTNRDFGPGEAFIAADRLCPGQDFDPARHGHRASVVGPESLKAVHIKLDGFEAASRDA